MKTKCSVFKLPKDESDNQTSLNVLLSEMAFRPIQLNFSSMRGLNTLLVWSYLVDTLIQLFCREYLIVLYRALPTPKPAAKKLKQEDVQLKYFMEKIPLDPLTNFIPWKRTGEKYNKYIKYNNVTSRQKYEIVHILMTQVFLSTEQTIILYCSQCGKLRSPLYVVSLQGRHTSSHKNVLNLKNVLKYHLQFFEALHAPHIFSLKEKDKIMKIQYIVQSYDMEKTEISSLHPRNLQWDESFLHLWSTERSFDECR